MYGLGILKGLGVTLKHFLETYLDDIRWKGKRYYTPEGVAHRSSSNATGIFTVQYPEEKLPPHEAARNFPFLVYEGDPEKGLRCVACKICEKECPPQCIYIVAERDPKGRPTIYTALRNALPKGAPRLMPVGRLDLNTEGLLLLTTDGDRRRDDLDRHYFFLACLPAQSLANW